MTQATSSESTAQPHARHHHAAPCAAYAACGNHWAIIIGISKYKREH